MKGLTYQLSKAGKLFWVAIGSLLFCIVTYLDYITGTHFSLSFFYLFPIFAFAWGVKGNTGVIAAVISAVLWVWLDSMDTETHSNIYLSLWNGVVRFGFFLLPVIMLRNLEKETSYARTDYLTGAVNNRYFRFLLGKEIERFARYRHPFSIAFIDIDNFKVINDTFGHTFGDNVLKDITDAIRGNLRKTDIAARMGGDEFAVLLPETNSVDAKSSMVHMKEYLFEQMQDKKWHVTFSIGVLTIVNEDLSVDEILRAVDQTMYIVKNTGKNDIKYVVK